MNPMLVFPYFAVHFKHQTNMNTTQHNTTQHNNGIAIF
jgi:hypothetical protein